MSGGSSIDFWFSVGSTYTYLTVSRLERVAKAEGVRFNWRPFSVRKLMQEQDNVPFATKPTKMGYMWRDVERRATMYWLNAKVPAPYPLKEFDLAKRLALLGMTEGWGKTFVVASYRRWLVEGQEPALEPSLSSSLADAGQETARAVERARSDDVTVAYEAATAEARKLGVFGSPTFAVDGELFWGDDRLDDAVTWRKKSSLSGSLTEGSPNHY